MQQIELRNELSKDCYLLWHGELLLAVQVMVKKGTVILTDALYSVIIFKHLSCFTNKVPSAVFV